MTMPPQVKLIEVANEALEAVLAEMIMQTPIETGMDPYILGPSTYWLIQAAEGAYVGYTGIHSINHISRRCRGIIFICEAYRRMGYGRQAVATRNDYLFDQLNMNRIEWAVVADNEQSLAFSEARAYAREEGRLKEAVYFNGKYHDVILYAALRRNRDLNLDKRNDFTNPGQGEP